MWYLMFSLLQFFTFFTQPHKVTSFFTKYVAFITNIFQNWRMPVWSKSKKYFFGIIKYFFVRMLDRQHM